MTQKELFVKIYHYDVQQASNVLLNSKKSLIECHKKLQSDYDLVIYNLEMSIEEAKVRRENQPKDALLLDIKLADLAIIKAKKILELGKIKAQSEFEMAYNKLKLDVENSNLYLLKEKDFLKFAEEECKRGFSIN